MSRRLLVAAWAVLLTIAALRPISNPALAADGAWKEKTQLVWAKGTGELIRKSFRVWDPHPELDLDFLWEPRTVINPTAPDDAATGPGTLTWHTKGAASYDRRFTYSVFKGRLKEGRPEGLGVLSVRTGRSYDGEWSDGLMHGKGVLRSEGGDKYEGDFVAGKMHGFGKYSSTDGWVYVGEFRDGLRDGTGKLSLVEGTYLTAWSRGQEINRERIPDNPSVQPPAQLRLAALSNTVKLKLSLNHKKAADYVGADPDTETHSYDADFAPGSMIIRLGSKKILDAWKMGGPIASGRDDDLGYVLSSWQFPPVFLTAEIENDGGRVEEIRSASLEIAESTTDLTPFLEIRRAEDQGCQVDDAYGPDLELRNLGWGRVKNARMIYSLGTPQNKTGEFSLQIGDFDTAKKTSIAGRLRELGVNTTRLKQASAQLRSDARMGRTEAARYAFVCEQTGVQKENANGEGQEGDTSKSDKEIEACVQRVRESGVLGRLKDSVYASDTKIYTSVAGRIEYEWTGADGKSRTGVSPFSMNVPLIAFNLEMGELGCEEPVVRPNTALNLPLDRRNHRIALPKTWNSKLAPADKLQVDLQLSAAKSSQHKFQLVLKLADGSDVVSPVIDLAYFRPRLIRR